MSGDPWLKFYPSDWRADPALRVCSVAARGLWMEMLCVMHEAEPRGSLLINGRQVSERQIAGLAGCSPKEATSLILELEEAGVFSRDDDGTIFSRRMRKDDAKAEKDKANGRSGGNPRLKGGVNPQDKAVDKAQKPEARSQRPEAPETKDDKLNHLASSAPEPEKPRPFPKDGSISFSPFADIVRKKTRGADPDVVAQAFRSFCFSNDIDFSDARIGKTFETFCAQHKVAGVGAH